MPVFFRLHRSLLVGLFLTLAAVAAAAVIRVPEDQPTLTAAFAAAEIGDEIVAQPGIYHESRLASEYGISLRSAVEGEYVVIDAAAGTFGVRIANVRAAVTLRWLEIRNATHRGLSLNVPPGRTGYDALVEHCRIVGNQGGGMVLGGGRNSDAGFVVRDTEIADNVTERFGGGLWASWYDLQMPILLERVVFRGNRSSDQGGGLCAFRSLRAVDCVWDGNVAKTRGGAIYGQFEDASVVIENGFFSKNVSLGEGGGFYADQHLDLELHDSIFVGNQAPVGPTGFVNTDGATLLHCCDYPTDGVAVGKDPVTLVVDDSDCNVAAERETLGDVKDLFR